VASGLLEVLDRETKESGQTLPEWLSTHPAPEGRVRRTHELAVASKPQYPQSTRVAADEHKAKVDGIVFGDDPRQGFVEGDVVKHPAFRFQFAVPQGWNVLNTPTEVRAISPDRNAMIQLSLEPSEGLGPEAFAARAAQSARAAVAQPSTERVHGAPAYLAVFAVTD